MACSAPANDMPPGSVPDGNAKAGESGRAEPEAQAPLRRGSATLLRLLAGLSEPLRAAVACELHSAVEGAIDAMAHPVWVLQADAGIDYANAPARQLMNRASWFDSTGGRVLRIGDLKHAGLLQALAPRHGDDARTWTAACAEGGRLRRAVLRVAPLGTVEPYASAWPHARALLALELAPEPAAAPWLGHLAAHHRLTPAEQRVLELLAAGASLEEIAGEQHVARNTVRAHLRALFSKLGARRQSDLVRLALGG